MPTLEISVHRPLTWWRASEADLDDFLSDPDVEDGRARWGAYDQNWKGIGAVVSLVADAIAEHAYTTDSNYPNIGFVSVDAPTLGEIETKIVKSWFSPGEAPTHDPWNVGLMDGRHRLWHTFAASRPRRSLFSRSKGIRLPLRSDALGYADSANTRALGQGWEKLYQDQLAELMSLPWFSTTDPMNKTFMTAMSTAADGKLPAFV